MNDKINSAKIIKMPSKPVGSAPSGTPQGPQMHPLILKLHQHMQPWIKQGLEAVFTEADDDLYKRSQGQNQESSQFFEGLKLLRKQQPTLTQAYLKHIEHHWLALQNLEKLNHLVNKHQQDLSLIDEEELEETLAVARIADKAEQACAHLIEPLKARLALVTGTHPEHFKFSNSPTYLVNAFQQAWATLEDQPTVDTKIVIYKHFEQVLIQDLPSCYLEMNEILSQAGILPHLKTNIKKSDQGRAQDRTEPSEEHQPQSALSRLVDPAEEQAARSIWHEIRQLLQPTGTTQSGQAVNLKELVEAVNALKEMKSLLGEIGLNGVAPTDLKQHLLKSLQKTPDKSISLGNHEATIDTVGLLFDHVLQEQSIPDSLRVMIAKLQVPYMKVAVLEPSLFAKPSHPARLYLNILGDLASKWSPDIDKQWPLNKTLTQSIRNTLEKALTHPKVFEEEFLILEQFLQNISKKSQIVEKRLEDVAKGKEKMEQAQQWVTQTLLGKLHEKKIPTWLSLFLHQYWPSYVLLQVLKDGQDSIAVKRSISLVDQLITAQDMRFNPTMNQSMQKISPILANQIEQGLKMVGFGEQDLKIALQSFDRFFKGDALAQTDSWSFGHIPSNLQLNPEDYTPASPSSHLSAKSSEGWKQDFLKHHPPRDSSPLDSFKPGSHTERRGSSEGYTNDVHLLEPDSPMPPSANLGKSGEFQKSDASFRSSVKSQDLKHTDPKHTEDAVQQHCIQQIKQLKVGDWLEWQEGTKKLRGKVSIISSFTGRMTLVNLSGQKISEKSQEEMSQLLRKRLLSIMPDKPLFERAMSSIWNRLKG